MGIYLGIFLIAFTTLALEVTLTRLLSVTTWYHLAFFAVSTAMLGMTAGAVTVYRKPDWFTTDGLRRSVAKACLGYALVVPITLTFLCLIPLDLRRSSMGYYALLAVTLVSMLPFYFSGIAVTAVLTKTRLPIGRLYASDLVGASLGCLLVLGGLQIFDAPSLILICGLVAIPAAVCFWGGRFSRQSGAASASILAALVILIALTSLSPYGIRPLVVKGRIDDPSDYIFEKWNSFSRVVVHELSLSSPQLWGASPTTPKDLKIEQYRMDIDGEAGTTLRRFESMDDIDHLRFDVANIAYYLRPRGGALIIGVGAGRDVQSAILFGHERVVGVDVNPIFIDLLEGRFRDFAGIADYPGVILVADEARSYLARSVDTYSIIQMSLIDTWAATGAGAFSLSENALYTVEAWRNFLSHLSEDGIFTVSRWYNPRDLGETGRLVSLAVACLLDLGVESPSGHIAMVTAKRISTLLVSRCPLTEADLSTLRRACADLRFDLALAPGKRPANILLEGIIASDSWDELKTATTGKPLNFAPPTDESPYFFNMLRFNQALPAFLSEPERAKGTRNPGVLRGNIVATRTLAGLILSLLILSVATIVFPLLLRTGRAVNGGPRADTERILWPAAAYFSLLGAGFMFVEIALVQRLSVFLGHPTYALGVLLFTIIASAGFGSYLSGRLPLTRVPWIYVYPVLISVAIVAVRFIMPALGATMASAPTVSRALASVVTILPLGVLLGVGFPTGMQLVRLSRVSETPWYWALNGVFGLLCSALTVFISIYFGISASLLVAAVCYLLLLFCLPAMRRVGEAESREVGQHGLAGE